ncbi:cysteine--tRNA ligase [Devosia sp.]|uniref:cysteine--tRNA ligase n=1 Tax=Devosia sp. TaxID=1871048 RepID=UPI002FC9F58B
MTSGTPQITLYNTLTRTKERFVPLDANNVRMYVCGPTVYDFAHIGNARPVIVFDVLFRLLRHVYGAEHVTYVRNITDVDDKINARALRDFPDLPLNEAIRRVTEKTETQFLSDARALGTLEPTVQPRATDNIAEMQALIGSLLQRGHAYNAAGEVLFDTTSMPDYGQLSGRNLEDNLAGARIAVDAHKKNPADFVLWKQSSDSEPGWDSPWGRGRPGWHIECSAMSERYLGQTFDIHGGGLDLIFPHHENEIAQSRCAHGTHAMANIWMHNGFLQVEGQKMSKSLGNFVTINELLETDKFGGRKWPGEVLRLAMLMTHYREPIDFSVRRLEEAESILQRLRRARNSAMNSRGGEILGDASVEQHVPNTLDIGYEGIVRFLADDLNTPAAIQTMQSLARAASNGVVAAGASLINAALLLGIRLDPPTQQPAGEDVAVDMSIAARLAALNAKDFAKADAIRNQLAEQGIALMDYKDEAGQRQTRWEVKR